MINLSTTGWYYSTDFSALGHQRVPPRAGDRESRSAAAAPAIGNHQDGLDTIEILVGPANGLDLPVGPQRKSCRHRPDNRPPEEQKRLGGLRRRESQRGDLRAQRAGRALALAARRLSTARQIGCQRGQQPPAAAADRLGPAAADGAVPRLPPHHASGA